MSMATDKIAKSFAEFYQGLYKNSDTCTDDAKLAEVLSDIKLTELTEPTATELDKPIEE